MMMKMVCCQKLIGSQLSLSHELIT